MYMTFLILINFRIVRYIYIYIKKYSTKKNNYSLSIYFFLYCISFNKECISFNKEYFLDNNLKI